MIDEREDTDEFLEEEREEQADDFLESRLGIDDLEEHDPDEHSFSFSSLEEVGSEEWSSCVSTEAPNETVGTLHTVLHRMVLPFLTK